MLHHNLLQLLFSSVKQQFIVDSPDQPPYQGRRPRLWNTLHQVDGTMHGYVIRAAPNPTRTCTHRGRNGPCIHSAAQPIIKCLPSLPPLPVQRVLFMKAYDVQPIILLCKTNLSATRVHQNIPYPTISTSNTFQDKTSACIIVNESLTLFNISTFTFVILFMAISTQFLLKAYPIQVAVDVLAVALLRYRQRYDAGVLVRKLRLSMTGSCRQTGGRYARGEGTDASARFRKNKHGIRKEKKNRSNNQSTNQPTNVVECFRCGFP